MSLTPRSSLPSNYESVRILVVEDEPKLGRLLVRGLGEEGHPADLAPSGMFSSVKFPAASVVGGHGAWQVSHIPRPRRG